MRFWDGEHCEYCNGLIVEKTITPLHREPTDYVGISRRLYEGQTIEEIFDRARKHWKE